MDEVGNEQRSETNVSEKENDETLRTRVGFPQQQEQRGFSVKIIVVIFVIIALLALGWFFLIRPSGESIVEERITPTPLVMGEETPTPTKEEINRKGVKIQVLNGTGTKGAAASLKEKLEELGYSDVKVGNAPNQDYTFTEVTFDEKVAQGIRSEIEKLLEDNYKDVEVKEKSLEDFDVVIITGLAVGQTATPTKAKSSATPTPTKAAVTPTAGTPTSTSTPTPTP